MIGEGVYARAYARALLGAAQDLRTVDAVAQDLRALDAQWRGSGELRSFCRSHPHGVSGARAQLVSRICVSARSLRA